MVAQDTEEVIDLTELIEKGAVPASAPPASAAEEDLKAHMRNLNDHSPQVDADIDELLGTVDIPDIPDASGTALDFSAPSTVTDHPIDPNEELHMPGMGDVDNLLQSLNIPPQPHERNNAAPDPVDTDKAVDDMLNAMSGPASHPEDRPAAQEPDLDELLAAGSHDQHRGMVSELEELLREGVRTPEPAASAPVRGGGVISAEELDSLLHFKPEPAAPAPAAPAASAAPLSADDLDILLASVSGHAPQADMAAASGQLSSALTADLDDLLDQAAPEKAPAKVPAQAPAAAPAAAPLAQPAPAQAPDPAPAAAAPQSESATGMDAMDLEALLAAVADQKPQEAAQAGTPAQAVPAQAPAAAPLAQPAPAQAPDPAPAAAAPQPKSATGMDAMDLEALLAAVADQKPQEAAPAVHMADMPPDGPGADIPLDMPIADTAVQPAHDHAQPEHTPDAAPDTADGERQDAVPAFAEDARLETPPTAGPAPDALAAAVEAAQTQAAEASSHAVDAFEQALEAASRAAETAEAVTALAQRTEQCENLLHAAEQRMAAMEAAETAEAVTALAQRTAQCENLLHAAEQRMAAMEAAGAAEAVTALTQRTAQCENLLHAAEQRMADMEAALESARSAAAQASAKKALEILLDAEHPLSRHFEERITAAVRAVLHDEPRVQAGATPPREDELKALLEERLQPVLTTTDSATARVDALENRLDALEPRFNERVEKAAAAAAARILREEIGRLLEGA